jgi:hypothetical protein
VPRHRHVHRLRRPKASTLRSCVPEPARPSSSSRWRSGKNAVWAACDRSKLVVLVIQE